MFRHGGLGWTIAGRIKNEDQPVMPGFDAAETAALSKLKELLDDQSIHIFTTEEVATLREMITAWRGLAALGFIGRLLRPGVWIIGIVVAIILAARGKFAMLLSMLWGT